MADTDARNGSPEPPFEVVCAREGDDLVLRVTGDLDAATWEAPERALAAALPSDARSVVVDLAGVRFADSSGLATLVRLRTFTHDRGLTLVLRSPRRQLTRLLRLSGLDRVFDVKSVSGP